MANPENPTAGATPPETPEQPAAEQPAAETAMTSLGVDPQLHAVDDATLPLPPADGDRGHDVIVALGEERVARRIEPR
jgi:hypothetical protein